MTLRPWCLPFAALLLLGCPSPPPKPPPDVQPPPPVDEPPPPPPDPQAIVDIATFRDHHCLVRRSGTVACWGRNTYGQAGNGAREETTGLVDVAAIEDARSVVTGRDFTCVLRAGGTVACWGNNEDGQLGDGKGVAPGVLALAPVEVQGLRDVTQIVAGEYHACALDRSGRVSCWGNGADGQIGRSVPRAIGTPQAVEELAPAKQIAAGASHVCALLEGGAVRCWGRNTEGQLGAGVTGSRANHVAVKGLSDVASIASGHLHTCAVKDGGGLACWGDNKGRQLGPAAGEEARSKTPVDVPGIDGAELVAGGARHTCVRLATKKVVCFGDDAAGQLAGAAGAARPDPVEAPRAKRAVDLALGEAHTCALAKSGALSCWGAVELTLPAEAAKD